MAPLVGEDRPGQKAQHRRFAATGRAEQRQELAFAHFEIEAGDRSDAAGEILSTPRMEASARPFKAALGVDGAKSDSNNDDMELFSPPVSARGRPATDLFRIAANRKRLF